MQNKITILAKLALLAATLPLLIGHALYSPSTDSIPIRHDANSYTLSGGPDPADPIYTANPLKVDVNYGHAVLNTTAGDTVAPFTFTSNYIAGSAIDLRISSTGPANAQLGPLWLHIVRENGETAKVKLCASTFTGPAPSRLFEARFGVFPDGAFASEVTTGPTRAAYVLSGSNESTTPITGKGDLTVSLDDMLIASGRIDTPSNISFTPNPIAFSATPGSVLTIKLAVTAVPNYAEHSELWLHLPSGGSVELAHAGKQTWLTQYNPPFFNAHFIIP